MSPHPYTADLGRQMTTRRFPIAPAPSSRCATAARDPQNARAAVEISMSDDLALTLKLGATASGLEPDEFVRRAIVEKAGREGLPALLSGVDLAARTDQVSIARREPCGVFTLLTTDEGDLIDVPPFQRRPHRRYDAADRLSGDAARPAGGAASIAEHREAASGARREADKPP